MTISDIRNPWLRRAVLALVAPAAIVTFAILVIIHAVLSGFGAAAGFVADEWLDEDGLRNGIKEAWRGPERDVHPQLRSRRP